MYAGQIQVQMCNGAMANSFRVFVLSPFAQSRNSALIVWPGDLELLVELKQCANKKNKKALDLDLYCFVFAYGLLLMWPRFILHMAWLTYYSDDVVVHSNDQIAGPLLNKRELWLKHNNYSSPMLQLASFEFLQRSDNVISVLLIKHHVSTWLLSQPSWPIQFGTSVGCIFSQATDTKLGKLVMDYLLVQWVTEAAFNQELACSKPNDDLFRSKNLGFTETRQIDMIQAWNEELFLTRITGNYSMSAHAI